ncbi:MAG TPA: hypothetical protein PK906_18000 [Spirochaetota bacterium]|nr:hypothetical protein [Spirochaetota bacterium]
MERENIESGIRFMNEGFDLSITRNGETIISAEQLYSIVFDLLTVNCFLPEDWPPIRQRYSSDRKKYEIAIGAETDSQVVTDIIDDEKYISELRPGEYFLESVIDPQRFLRILKNKLVYLGLTEGRDFSINYSRRLGRISITLCENG